MVGEMTFVEAMADEPGLGLEVQDRCGNWVAFDTCGQYQPAFLARAKFRRARPKRSRVQEMEAAFGTDGEWRRSYGRGATAAIHAVCAFFRDEPGTNGLAEQTAKCIEREFLEPR